MGYITVYEPICSSEGNDCWFKVNGSIDADRDNAIRKAQRHSAFRDGKAKVERVEEHIVWDEDFYEKD
jgi:hypothetical protein